jgi:hypothetical protein
MTERREVEDGEPAVAEGHAGLRIDPGSCRIGPAVAESVSHRGDGPSRQIGIHTARCVQVPDDSAHM